VCELEYPGGAGGFSRAAVREPEGPLALQTRGGLVLLWPHYPSTGHAWAAQPHEQAQPREAPG